MSPFLHLSADACADTKAGNSAPSRSSRASRPPAGRAAIKGADLLAYETRAGDGGRGAAVCNGLTNDGGRGARPLECRSARGCDSHVAPLRRARYGRQPAARGFCRLRRSFVTRSDSPRCARFADASWCICTYTWMCVLRATTASNKSLRSCFRPHPGVRGLSALRLLRLSRPPRSRYAFATAAATAAGDCYSRMR